MAVWLSISESKLRRDTPALRATTREYLTELIKVSSLAGADTVGEKIPTDAQNAMKSALTGIVDKYYSNSRAAQRAYRKGTYRKSGAKLIDEFSSWSKSAEAVYVESVEIVEKDTVLDNGNVFHNYSFEPVLMAGKYAEVYFNFEADVVYYTSNPSDFGVYPFGYNGSHTEIYYDKPVIDGEDGDLSGKLYRAEGLITITGRIIFVRENGEWRIACTDSIRAYPSSQVKYDPLKKEVG